MPTVARDKAHSLDAVFDSLQKLLARHAPPFKKKTGLIKQKHDFHLVVPKPVSIPGSYGGKPVEVAMASIILQKGYVGFYFMPVYADPECRKNISPALLKLLKGKSCFYFKTIDAALLDDVESALRQGTELFKSRGWL